MTDTKTAASADAGRDAEPYRNTEPYGDAGPYKVDRAAGQRYFLHCLLPFLLMVVGLGIFTLTSDPYMLRTADAGTLHTVPVSLRLSKPLQVVARQPETVFLGSSRTLLGIDPRHLDDRSYNFGVSGMSGPELEVLGKFCLRWTDVKRIIINVDDFMFDARATFDGGLSEDVDSCRHLIESVAAATLSYQALKDSARVHFPNPGKGVWRADGFMIAPPRGADFIERELAAFSRRPPNRFADDQFACLDRLLAACQQQGVQTILYIPPIHRRLYDAAVERDGHEAFLGYRRTVQEIATKWDVPCYDFTPPNGISSTKLIEPTPYYSDAAHYTPRVGDLLLLRMGLPVRPDPADLHFLSDLAIPNYNVQFVEQPPATQIR